jgi:hypothetical protein
MQNTLNCSDYFLALLIKHTAVKESELYQTLEHLKFTDGTFEAAGLDGVKALMEEDYAPSGHLIKKKSRERVYSAWRKHRERPRWWVRRFDRYVSVATLRVAQFSLTPVELAEIYLNHSWLDLRE